MSNSRRRTLTAALLIVLNGFGVAASAATLEYVGTYVWDDEDPRFGGFSGIEITDAGRRFYALSDRANLFWGTLDRDAAGRIRHVNIAGRAHLKDHDGAALQGGYLGDSEGLAVDGNGKIAISFEGLHRVARYDSADAASKPLPRPPGLQKIAPNQGFESLAVLDDGSLITFPEDSRPAGTPSPAYVFRRGRWTQPFSIRHDPDWQAVGSDMGPEGWFYLLERGFNGLFGFSSRVRRFQITENSLTNEQILFESRSLQYDNLEGISVWKDELGVRLTMISDDNFLFVQRTEFVEYRLRESPRNN